MITNDIIDEVLESILFVSGNGLSIEDISRQLEVDKDIVDAAVMRLQNKFGGKSGIVLLKYKNKIQFASNPEYADIVSCVLNPIKERELSNAAMETMAIIAYRQPVTRLEIEQIRGVNCEYTVQLLLKNDLIEVVGRKDVVGKPLLFGTTDNFLKRFRISDINELPDYNQLIESIKVIENNENKEAIDSGSLYNEFEISEGEDTPEFLSGEDVSRIE